MFLSRCVSIFTCNTKNHGESFGCWAFTRGPGVSGESRDIVGVAAVTEGEVGEEGEGAGSIAVLSSGHLL